MRACLPPSPRQHGIFARRQRHRRDDADACTRAAANRDWDESLESELERGWQTAKGTSRMAWNDAKAAVRHAWHGVERVMPGDADKDGR